MNSLIKYLILIFAALLLASSDSFSSDTDINDDSWSSENFENSFRDNPQDGFQRNPKKAWDIIGDDPTILTDNPDMASSAAENDPKQFVSTVGENEDLLSDKAVFDEYRKIMGNNVDVVNENLESLGKYLEKVGVEGPQTHEYTLKNYEPLRQIFIFETQGGNLISISESDLQGSSLNSDGTVSVLSGQRILEGNVISQQGGELQVSSSTPNQPARVENQGIEFSGNMFNVGIDPQTSNQFVRAIEEVSFTDFLGRDAFLTSQTRLSVNQKGDYGLQGRIETRSLRNQGTVHEFRSVNTAYETDFPSSSNEEMILSVRANCCEGVSNYIIEQTTDDGSTLMNVKVQGQGNPKIEVPQGKVIQIQSELIEDNTRLSVIQRGPEGVQRQFDITRETTKIAGFGVNEGDDLTIITTHEGRFHPGRGEEKFSMLFNANNPEGIRSNQILTSEEGGGLTQFPQELREQLQNADFGTISQNEQSIVDALNSLDLPSDFQFRSELAEELGIEEYQGSASQNEQMLNMLREGELNTGPSSYLAGEEFPERFELDPQFEGVIISPEEQLPPSLQNANFEGVDFGDSSIVDIMDQMGLDSSFAARQQLYREIFEGKNPPEGGPYGRGSDMNIALRNALREMNAEGVISTRGDTTEKVSEFLTNLEIAQGHRMTPRGNNFDGGVVIRDLPSRLREYHPDGMTVDEAAARTLFGECRSCSDTEMRLLADVMRNRAYLHNGDFNKVIFSQWQFSPWNGFTTNAPLDDNGKTTATTPMDDPHMQKAMEIWKKSAHGDTSDGATHFYKGTKPKWAPSFVSTVPLGTETQHKIGYLSKDDPFRPAVLKAQDNIITRDEILVARVD